MVLRIDALLKHGKYDIARKRLDEITSPTTKAAWERTITDAQAAPACPPRPPLVLLPDPNGDWLTLQQTLANQAAQAGNQAKAAWYRTLIAGE